MAGQRSSEAVTALGISIDEMPRAVIASIHGNGSLRSSIDVKMEFGGRTLGQGYAQIIPELIQAFRSAAEDANPYKPIEVVGLSLPGNIDQDKFKVVSISRAGSREPISVDFRSLKGPLREVRQIDRVDNDVTCAAAACHILDYRREATLAYIYVDRGVNVGVVKGGETYRGAMNPELGHFSPRLDLFPGEWEPITARTCIFHRQCFEALIVRDAIEARWPGSLIKILSGAKGHGAKHKFIADAISQLCEITTLTFAPDKIVIGGYPNDILIESIRERFDHKMRGYPNYQSRVKNDFITTSNRGFSSLAALGAALQAFRSSQSLY